MDCQNTFRLLLAPAALCCLTGVFYGCRESSFPGELIRVDTSAVYSMVLQPQLDPGTEITLTREGTDWMVSNGTLSTKAAAGSVDPMLRELALIKMERIAANNRDKWAEYEVSDGKGSRVRVYDRNNQVLEDFVAGRFAPDPQPQSGISSLRLAKGDEVYAVNGPAATTFNQGFDYFRDKRLLQFDPGQNINRLELILPGDSLITLQKTQNQWIASNGAKPDTTALLNYLSGLRSISGAGFAEGFDEVSGSSSYLGKLKIFGDHLEVPAQIGCFPSGNPEQPFVLHSSQNPDAYFSSDSSGVYRRIFGTLQALLSEKK